MSSLPIAPALASPTLHSFAIYAAGQLWRALPETRKAKYKSGLTCLAALGRGGKRTWVQRWESDTILETLQEAIEEEHSAGSLTSDEQATFARATETATAASPSLDHGQGTTTPGQQALHAARQCMRRSHTDAEKYQVVRTLALALGSKHPAAGTIKALEAVLMLLERPEMSDEEAYTFTGASLTNLKRWRKQVQSLQSAHVGVSLA